MVKKIKKKNEKINSEKEHRKDKNTIISIVIIVTVVSTLVVIFHGLNNTPANSGQAAIVDGIQCDNVTSSNFHINAHLDVFVDGKSYFVPEKIGIVNGTCSYWIHTTDNTGTINIEAPMNDNFTLGQLFDIWEATGSNLPPHGMPIIYINGQQVASSLNTIEIKSHDEITVVYGVKPQTLPTSYQFSPGF
ncbi:MAG: hypothetical protein KGH89_05875 [Thaumarchaeota archaeon]|nr:hypothetical protein [Nitrososphaerota archaeon]